MTIYFYTTTDKLGEFSNFSKYGFVLKEQYWPTVEHYFQAQKFAGTPLEERIRLANTPKQAKKLGHDRSVPLRKDWETVKDDIMREAIIAKFKTHKKLMELLFSTGNEILVESSPYDYYWGCGADGSGKNMLGKILMEIRDILKINQEV